eukprot:10749941-Karenia_brevis.AAC.1
MSSECDHSNLRYLKYEGIVEIDGCSLAKVVADLRNETPTLLWKISRANKHGIDRHTINDKFEQQVSGNKREDDKELWCP